MQNIDLENLFTERQTANLHFTSECEDCGAVIKFMINIKNGNVTNSDIRILHGSCSISPGGTTLKCLRCLKKHKKSKYVSPKPRYDEVFFEGINLLDNLL